MYIILIARVQYRYNKLNCARGARIELNAGEKWVVDNDSEKRGMIGSVVYGCKRCVFFWFRLPQREKEREREREKPEGI